MLEARPPSVAARSSQGALPPAPPGPSDGKSETAIEADRTTELATEVATAVRELRADAGLSERAAARLLGTSQTQLRRMEDPRYLPSLRSLARVAAAYGHRLRIAFEQRERQPARAARPAPRSRPAVPPRQRRVTTTRPARSGRPRRRA